MRDAINRSPKFFLSLDGWIIRGSVAVFLRGSDKTTALIRVVPRARVYTHSCRLHIRDARRRIPLPCRRKGLYRPDMLAPAH